MSTLSENVIKRKRPKEKICTTFRHILLKLRTDIFKERLERIYLLLSGLVLLRCGHGFEEKGPRKRRKNDELTWTRKGMGCTCNVVRKFRLATRYVTVCIETYARDGERKGN